MDDGHMQWRELIISDCAQLGAIREARETERRLLFFFFVRVQQCLSQHKKKSMGKNMVSNISSVGSRLLIDSVTQLKSQSSCLGSCYLIDGSLHMSLI